MSFRRESSKGHGGGIKSAGNHFNRFYLVETDWGIRAAECQCVTNKSGAAPDNHFPEFQVLFPTAGFCKAVQLSDNLRIKIVVFKTGGVTIKTTDL